MNLDLILPTTRREIADNSTTLCFRTRRLLTVFATKSSNSLVVANCGFLTVRVYETKCLENFVLAPDSRVCLQFRILKGYTWHLSVP